MRNELNKNKELTIGAQDLEGWEGYKPEVYLDSENIETIGIGRNLEMFPLEPDELEDNGTYHHTNAVAWIYDRLAEFRKTLVLHLPWLTEQPPEVRILLTDIGYNIGLSGLLKLKLMISAIKECKYSQAAMELKDSKYFKKKGQRALAHYRTLVRLAVK